jgi:hypothetical protein
MTKLRVDRKDATEAIALAAEANAERTARAFADLSSPHLEACARSPGQPGLLHAVGVRRRDGAEAAVTARCTESDWPSKPTSM